MTTGNRHRKFREILTYGFRDNAQTHRQEDKQTVVKTADRNTWPCTRGEINSHLAAGLRSIVAWRGYSTAEAPATF